MHDVQPCSAGFRNAAEGNGGVKQETTSQSKSSVAKNGSEKCFGSCTGGDLLRQSYAVSAHTPGCKLCVACSKRGAAPCAQRLRTTLSPSFNSSMAPVILLWMGVTV